MPKAARKRPAAARASGRAQVGTWALAAAGLAVLAAAGFWAAKKQRAWTPSISPPALSARTGAKPGREQFIGYGGSASCRECHAEEYLLWQGSHHALAERPIQPGPDRAAFVPARALRHGAQVSEVCWSNRLPQVTCAGPSDKPGTYTVERVIGEEPLRQFLVPFPGGRYQVLETAFDPRSNEWFNVFGAEERRPGEWGHWTGRGMNWNYMCASCHNTRLRRNYDAATDSYHTLMAEPGVGCEACHGPLQEHNRWQSQFGKSGRRDPTLTHFTRRQFVDTCGYCHARRTELVDDFTPGDDFFDRCELTIVDHSGRYYADGQVHDEDYEYGSFLSSRMAGRGVVCQD